MVKNFEEFVNDIYDVNEGFFSKIFDKEIDAKVWANAFISQIASCANSLKDNSDADLHFIKDKSFSEIRQMMKPDGDAPLLEFNQEKHSLIICPGSLSPWLSLLKLLGINSYKRIKCVNDKIKSSDVDDIDAALKKSADKIKEINKQKLEKKEKDNLWFNFVKWHMETNDEEKGDKDSWRGYYTTRDLAKKHGLKSIYSIEVKYRGDNVKFWFETKKDAKKYIDYMKENGCEILDKEPRKVDFD